MILKFNDIINKHKGKKAVIVGHGPSSNQYLDQLNTYKDNGYIIFGCNYWYNFYTCCSPHYWVMANTICTPKTEQIQINKNDAVLLYADSVYSREIDWIKENIAVDYLPYDQRHFNGKKCSVCDRVGCISVLNPSRLTIQEELQKYTGFDLHYSSGDTVALHMIAFSILMGCSEVFLLGLDLNYELGYAKNTKNYPVPYDSFKYTDSKGKNILNDINIIINSAKKIGVNIINTNRQSGWKA